LIRQISKFFFLFIIIVIFINFKNYTKILDNKVNSVKSIYNKELQLYLKRDIQLTKMINQIQIEESQNQYVNNEDILKINRDTYNDLTLIKVSYDKSE
tara:strand:- start:1062 stop:1355 length:294 start_codon:yes stop_codon:yes gene_type:complete